MSHDVANIVQFGGTSLRKHTPALEYGLFTNMAPILLATAPVSHSPIG